MLLQKFISLQVVELISVELDRERGTRSSVHCSLQSLTNSPLGGWYLLRDMKTFLDCPFSPMYFSGLFDLGRAILCLASSSLAISLATSSSFLLSNYTICSLILLFLLCLKFFLLSLTAFLIWSNLVMISSAIFSSSLLMSSY